MCTQCLNTANTSTMHVSHSSGIMNFSLTKWRNNDVRAVPCAFLFFLMAARIPFVKFTYFLFPEVRLCFSRQVLRLEQNVCYLSLVHEHTPPLLIKAWGLPPDESPYPWGPPTKRATQVLDTRAPLPPCTSSLPPHHVRLTPSAECWCLLPAAFGANTPEARMLEVSHE